MREKDISGHLKSDREKNAEKKNQPVPSMDKNAVAWWKDIGSKKDSDLSDKEKLFKADYQAYQAFTYLKALKTLKTMAK